jgi:YlmC/YmxH family sporulation protein
MHVISTADLRQKEIINLCDGGRLGYANDFELDIDDGKIIALLVNSSGSFWGFGKCNEIRICWDKIQCIGEDTILVKIPPAEIAVCDNSRRKCGWFR